MKRQQFISTSALCSLSVLIVGCNSATSTEAYDDSPVLGAALPLVSIPTHIQSFNDTNYVGTSDQELGYLAQVPITQTASIRVMDDFDFSADRQTQVSFAVPNAINLDAEATFCTEYKIKPSGDYRINYNSCVLSAPVLGGTVNEALNLANQHESVIGVVSFQDANIQPIYQEFHFD